MRIDLFKPYIIPLTGCYNAAVFECPHCGCNILHNFYDHIVGFSEAPIGFVKITECPNCFEKYYCHADEHDLSHFLSSVDAGKNLHNRKN